MVFSKRRDGQNGVRVGGGVGGGLERFITTLGQPGSLEVAHFNYEPCLMDDSHRSVVVV